MVCENTYDSLPALLADIPELRREAYVHAALKMQAEDSIAGVFGSAYTAAYPSAVDEAVFYGFGLVPIPVAGVDAFIFKHGEYVGCDVIKSTMIYLTTQKCPLLYSSKMYILDGCCPAVEQAFLACTDKPVYVCTAESRTKLPDMLARVYGRVFSAERYAQAQRAFEKLNQQLHRLECSCISGNDLGIIAFYTRFIFDLDERIAFLERICSLLPYQTAAEKQPERKPFSVYCPDGIMTRLQPESGTYFKPVPPNGTQADAACAGCIYPAAQYLPY